MTPNNIRPALDGIILMFFLAVQTTIGSLTFFGTEGVFTNALLEAGGSNIISSTKLTAVITHEIENGLSAFIKPSTDSFRRGESLSFIVTLKNTSTAPYMLFGSQFYHDWVFSIEETTTGATWKAVLEAEFERVYAPAITLEPGQEIQRSMKLNLFTFYPQKNAVTPELFFGQLPVGKYRIIGSRRFVADTSKTVYKFSTWIGEIKSNWTQFNVIRNQ
jgi:hypothetical protein